MHIASSVSVYYVAVWARTPAYAAVDRWRWVVYHGGVHATCLSRSTSLFSLCFSFKLFWESMSSWKSADKKQQREHRERSQVRNGLFYVIKML